MTNIKLKQLHQIISPDFIHNIGVFVTDKYSSLYACN